MADPHRETWLTLTYHSGLAKPILAGSPPSGAPAVIAGPLPATPAASQSLPLLTEACPPLTTAEVVARFLASKKAAHLAPATIEGYGKRLRPFARRFLVLPTTPERVEDFLADKPDDTPTAADAWKILAMLYAFAKERLGVPDVMALVARPRFRPKTPGRLTPGQARDLLAAVEGDPRAKGLVYAYLGVGLRLSEGTRLDCGDIRVDTISIRGKERSEDLPLLPGIRDVLLVLTDGRKADAPLFIGRKGGRLRPNSVDHIIRRAFRRAGIQGVKPSAHTLRHTRGVLWDAAGGSAFASRRLLRHRSTMMTDLYTQLNFTELRQQDGRFNPLITLGAIGPDSEVQNTSSAPL